jgi:pyruvate/2-oxoglutarate dehydrogenase complex dihydrolipoamide dehydrogenase (E3) component
MAVEYDLVIVGSSAAGIEAAIAAVRRRARVALVEQNITIEHPGEAIALQVLAEVAQMLQQADRSTQFGLTRCTPQTEDIWQQADQWVNAAVTALADLRSPAGLAALGIEVISGCGEFYRKPRLGFAVNGRSLRSRAYLLATGCCPRLPDIEGLAETGCLTTLTQPTAIQAIPDWVIIGGTATAVVLAQTLNRLGCGVTLIASETQILPEAEAAARLVQAQLEAEGVRIWTQARVTQVKQIGNQKWVQAGNQAIAAAEIFLAVGHQPNLNGLNLAAANVRWSANGLLLSDTLQTTNPKIYACLGQIGRDYAPHIASYQAQIAIANLLDWPHHRTRYSIVPRTIPSDPELATIGLTPAQAIQRYGKDILISRQSLKTLPHAQIRGHITGFCQLVARRNGAILGAQVVGTQATESIATIALAMQQNQPVAAIANLPFPTATFAELIRHTAVQWQQMRLEYHQSIWERLRRWLRGWRSG